MLDSATDREIIFRYTNQKHDVVCILLIREFINNGALAEIIIDQEVSVEMLRYQAHHIELRNTISGPAKGGAAIGIALQASDPRLNEVLDSFKSQISHFIQTGLQIIEDKGDSPVLLDTRFFAGAETMPIKNVIDAWSIAEAARHFYNFWGGNMNSKRLVISDWNTLTQQLAYYLSKHNAALVGFCFEGEYYYRGNAWSVLEIQDMIKQLDLPHEEQVSEDLFMKQLSLHGAEIFVCSHNLVDENIERALQRQGIELMLCTQPNHNRRPQEYETWLNVVDKTCSVLPSFIVQSGGARLRNVLETNSQEFGDVREYLSDVGNMIEAALMKIHQFNMKPSGIYAKSTEIADKMNSPS
jgi:hypothetical protein